MLLRATPLSILVFTAPTDNPQITLLACHSHAVEKQGKRGLIAYQSAQPVKRSPAEILEEEAQICMPRGFTLEKKRYRRHDNRLGTDIKHKKMCR